MGASGQLTLLEDPLDTRFLHFHHNHPDVYDQLVQILEQCATAGAQHVSLRDAFGHMRLDRTRRGLDADGFALNNSFCSRYARLIAGNRPDLARLLTTRQLRTGHPHD